MAQSDEWTEYHLTKQGWIRGNQRTDPGVLKDRPLPQDRLLTVAYRETGSGYGSIYASHETKWESTDTKLVEELLAVFGPPPKDL